jgi:hypothetical protein
MKINMWRLNNGKINITINDEYSDYIEFQLTKEQVKKLRKQLKKMI